MNLGAKVSGADRLAGDLKKIAAAVTMPAADAAATMLAGALEQNRAAQGLVAPLEQTASGARRNVTASDSDSVAHELGTLKLDAAPWLAPSLPAALGPMRAAVATAVARAISSLRLKA